MRLAAPDPRAGNGNTLISKFLIEVFRLHLSRRGRWPVGRLTYSTAALPIDGEVLVSEDVIEVLD